MSIQYWGRRNLFLSVSLLLSMGISMIVFGQDHWSTKRFIDIRNVRESTFEIQGFKVEEDIKIKITAIGGALKGDWYAKGWILDAESREVFWEMDDDNTSRGKSRRDRKFDEEVIFPAGFYEVYFAVNPTKWIRVDDFSDLVEGIVKGFDQKPSYSKRWGISLEPAGGQSDLEKIYPYQPTDDGQAVVQMIEVGDDEHLRTGFSINKSMDLQIYMIGEGSRSSREMYDYGWIVDADTRERVWEANARRSDHAGGAYKNRLFDDVITLPAGNYIVYFITDDSHSAEMFNMMPPYDPRHWGITIWAVGGDLDDAYITEFEEETEEPIVEIVRVGEDRVESQGFELVEPTRIRVYAIGELGSSGMVDYGWIVDARTREIVWEMTRRNTEHAGGGRKNRMVDEVIELPAGKYLTYYTTDIGHSYDDWNTGPPFDPEAYGITLWGVGDDYDPASVREYREEDDERVLASLIRMRDDAHGRQRFTLEKRTKVWIYAIGEGRGNTMYDYGWIEDEDGRKVWKMRYEETSHAGGTRKNRLFNDRIILDPGEYEVHFRTDGSHSFEDWNASKPDDPAHWGITILIDEPESQD